MSSKLHSEVAATAAPEAEAKPSFRKAFEHLDDIEYPSAQDFLEAFSQPVTAEDFIRVGPLQAEVSRGWPGTLWDRAAMYDDHPIYRAPQARPGAADVLGDLQSLAGTDTPARDYPEDFFSRSEIYGG